MLRFQNEIRTLYWVVSIIGIITGSLLAIAVVPSSNNFEKGVTFGFLLASYLWLLALVLLKCASHDQLKSNSKHRKFSEALTQRATEDSFGLEVDKIDC